MTFEWPWQYNFPPFFTLQINQETRNQQLTAWRLLVLEYTKLNKQTVLDVREAQSTPLFSNSSINRRLELNGIIAVMEQLEKTGNAEVLDKARNRWHIYWQPLDELASAIYKWANNNGMIGTVCTLYELTQGDDTKHEVFYGLSESVLLKALRKLEHRKKAEIISDGDSQGVKFF